MGTAGQKATFAAHGYGIGRGGCAFSHWRVDILPKDGEDVCGYSIKLNIINGARYGSRAS